MPLRELRGEYGTPWRGILAGPEVTVRLGIVLDYALGLEDQLRQVEGAEADGLDTAWSLHILQSGLDALTLLALAGRRTERIELGTAVVPIYPYHPLALAGHAMTAQVACGGRLTLGIGVSHQPVVEDVLGEAWRPPARFMREFLSVLLPLIRGGEVDFSGAMLRVKARYQVPGGTPMPVLLAALGPAMLRLAGQAADGTITWMAGPRVLETQIIPGLVRAAAGRPAPRVCAALPLAVTDDPDEALAQAAERFRHYATRPSYRRLLDLEGVAGPEGIAIVGNEAVVERRLRALADIGVTDFAAIVFPATDDAAASTARTRELLRGLARDRGLAPAE